MILEKLPVNAFRICIETLDTDISGIAYTPLTKEEIAFSGYSKLLLQMDRLFDLAGYPESFQEKRSFRGGKKEEKERSFHGMPEALLETEEIRGHRGKVATVEVMVVSRRNASWQGQIFFENEKGAVSFSSEVDLLNKILSHH